MKALVKVKNGPGNLQVLEVPEPKLQAPDEVLIRVRAAGICGTDIHILHDEFTYYPPVILGHEFSGEVVETGAAVTRFKPGDKVVGEPHTRACGVCDLCREGMIQLCPEKRSPGWGQDGAFTKYIVMPEKLLHRVADHVPFEVAAFCEPLAIVMTALHTRCPVQPLDFVAVIGVGPIGILSAIVAKAAGAGTVAVLGTDADEALRFPAAKRLGADHIINVQKEDPVEVLNDLTKGRGVDLAVECSGAAAGIRTAAQVLHKGGRLCGLGMTGKAEVPLPWNLMLTKMLDVHFSFSSAYQGWVRGISLLEKTPYDLSSIITCEENLENWEQLFTAVQKGEVIKGMFRIV